MALQERGVRLVVENQSAFNQALAASNAAVNTLGTTSAGTARDIDTLTNRITFQQRTLGVLQQELAQTAQKYGEGSTQAQRKQIAVDKLTVAIAKDEAALDQLQRQETQTAQSSNQLAQGFDKAGQSSSRFGEVMTGALRRVGEMAVNALASAAQAVGAFIATSVKGAGDYEQSMNVLQATTGATDEKMQQVADTAKALGADLTLPATSAASAGDAMLYLTQQGLSLDDALAGAKGTLQLAAAGMVTEKEAAETAATALNQFGLAGSKATQVADLLAASVSASGSNVTATGQAIQQAGTSFAKAGVPLEVFVTLVNEMSQAGIKGSDAGTSLKTMMQRLQAPTDKAAHAMEKLNIQVYDQAGAMLPMRDIIGQFSTNLKDLTQEQRDQAIVTIFGSDAQRAANIVLAGGVDAYDKMFSAVTRQGAAAELAGARMKGLNGAVAGLGSQLETLALEAIEPLLPLMTAVVTEAAEFAGSLVGQVGPAVSSVIGFLTSAAEVITTAALPALSGLTAAVIAYAVAQAVQATPAILASIPALAAQTAAFVANAAAVALAAAPYIAIAAAVGGVVLAYQNLNEKINTATDELLASKPFWTDATAALENYAAKSGDTAAELKPLADNIAFMRDLIREETEDLGRRVTMGLVNEQQMQAELATINQHAAGLQAATAAYNNQEQALIKAQAASMTATAQNQDATAALGDHVEQIELTEKEIEELAKVIDKAMKDGTQAVEDYTTQAASFMEQLGDTSKAVNDRITEDQAAAYAEQAAAQRAHLGAMLSDYTMAQRSLGNITNEQADVILTAIEKQFGVADDTSQRTFLSMEQAIDRFATSGGESADELAGHLGTLQTDAIETRIEMDALAKQYTAELVQNFKDGKIDAQQLREELEKVPAKVYSEVHVHTEYTSSGEPPRSGGSETRHQAAGGPVEMGQRYTVGEFGPEQFIPWTNGQIVPNSKIAPPASPQQIINVPRPQIIIMQPASTTNTTNNYAPPAADTGLSSDHLFALLGSRG